jgi:capsular polysaccharide biosynthesis protein
MDLNEAAQRIFKYHWVLILLMTVIGLSVPALLVASKEDAYAASARIVMGSADAKDGQAANALADTALALATSPGSLTTALETAGVQRAESDVADHVRVDPVGTSGVLQISVTDRDPAVSAAIANALAAEIVQRRETAILGDTEALLAQTDEQITALAQNVAAIEAEADAAARAEALARARGESPGSSLQAISLRHSQAVAQLNRMQGQRQDLAQNLAQAVRPEVIDDTATRGTLVQSGLAARLAVGGLLGLILGIALAATWEAWRPTLSPAALARHLGVPLLGHVKRLPRDATQLSDRWLASYVSLAADGAGVRSFELVPVGPGVDVAGLARSLAAETDQETPGQPGRDIVPVTLDGPHDSRLPSTWTQPGTGVVVVAPRKVKSTWLTSLERHVHLTRQPVIGVISYAHEAPVVEPGKAQASKHVPSTAPSRTGQQDSAPTVSATS